MAQVHSSGVHIALLAGIKDVFLPFRVNLAITDGQWHHIALVWNGPNGAITLTTDGVIVGRVENCGVNRTLSQFGWMALGAPNLAAKTGRTTDSKGISLESTCGPPAGRHLGHSETGAQLPVDPDTLRRTFAPDAERHRRRQNGKSQAIVRLRHFLHQRTSFPANGH